MLKYTLTCFALAQLSSHLLSHSHSHPTFSYNLHAIDKQMCGMQTCLGPAPERLWCSTPAPPSITSCSGESCKSGGGETRGMGSPSLSYRKHTALAAGCFFGSFTAIFAAARSKLSLPESRPSHSPAAEPAFCSRRSRRAFVLPQR